MMSLFLLNYRSLRDCVFALIILVLSLGWAVAYGDSLAFTSDRIARFQIYREDFAPNANGQKELTPSGTPAQVTFSGSGAQESRGPDWTYDAGIAYHFGASGVRGIHKMDNSGFDQRLTFSPGDERDPSSSPDGRFIVYARKGLSSADYDLWIHNTSHSDDSADYALLVRPSTIDLRPAWSPDGEWIAFATSINGRLQIAKVRVAFSVAWGGYLPASGVTLLTNNSDTNFDPSWSPGSSQLAYSKQDATGVHVYRMSGELGEASQVKLTTHSAANRNPSWSPDGSLIAFTSERDGNREIYLMSSEFGELGVSSANALDRNFGRNHFQRVTNDPATDDDSAWYKVPLGLYFGPPYPLPAYRILDVPYFSQSMSSGIFTPWATDLMGNSGQRISQIGCMITSVAMILNYHGVKNIVFPPSGPGIPVDPGSLNAWLNQVTCVNPNNPATCTPQGYNAGGNLKLGAIEAFAAYARFYFPSQPLIEIVDQSVVTNLLSTIATEIDNGNPSLLRVNHPNQHWVVATGYFVDPFDVVGSIHVAVNDPASPRNRTALERQQVLQGTYQPARVWKFHKTNSNLSSFYVWVSAPAKAIVTDPVGRRIGFDQSLGDNVNEVPAGDAFLEEAIGPLDDDGEVVPGASAVSGYVVQIDDPVSGQYRVNVVAAPGQAYLLDVTGFDRNANSQAMILRSTLKAGEQHTYSFAYDPEPAAATLTLQPIADPTGNGVVDCEDIRRVKAAFGKRYGVPGYDSRVDAVMDGRIDVRDLAFISKSLPVGTRCP